MEYFQFEKEVFEKTFNCTENKAFKKIYTQFLNSKMTSRDLTGGGYYLEIQVKKDPVYQLDYRNDYIFGNTFLFKQGKHKIGFLFYIDEGYLVQLEGYFFDEELELSRLQGYTIEFDKGKVCIPDFLKEK